MASVFPVSTVGVAQAEKDAIQYSNGVFTKKLYKNTKKIKFFNKITKDKNKVKKIYALLAKMKLQQFKPDPDEPVKCGFVSITIYTKKNEMKRYSFQGDRMSTNSKKYKIIENYPIDAIREIFNS